MDPEELEAEDQAIDAAAEREAAQGYGMAGLRPGMGVPAPQQFQLQGISDAQILKALGKNDVFLESGAWPHQRDEYRKQYMMAQAQAANASADQYKAYLGAMAKQQDRNDKIAIAQGKLSEKANDPFFRAQNIYGQTGNLAAARVIAKTTGPALFKLGEQVDLGPDQMFAIRPVGDLDIAKPDGTSARVPTWQFLQANGVNVVPYLGGDEEAKAFRNMAARMGEVMVSLRRLEEAYTTSGNISSPYSDLKADLVQIEGTLARDVSQLRSGSKSMAGVSDKELEAIQQTLPQSATNLRDTKGEGARRARNTRQQLMGLMMRTARMNGVELVQLKPQSAPTREVTTPRGTPPGVKPKPNGQQSGSSTSGQPR